MGVPRIPVPVPLNTLSPRGAVIDTDLLPILPEGAQILESCHPTDLADYIIGKIPRAPLYVFDGGGSALVAPLVRAFQVPFALTISGVTLLADQSGSCVVDIGVVPYASYTGAFAGSITASDKPTLATAVKYQDTTLTGWTLSIPANSALIFKLVSASTITWLTATLGCVG